MKTEYFVGKQWDLYINNWFICNQVQFLDDGSIAHNGVEGFHHWKIENDAIYIYDNLDKLSYELIYLAEANLLQSRSNHLYANNHLFLAYTYSANELQKMYENNPLASQIANKSAAFRSPKGEVWGHLFFGIDGKIYHYGHENEHSWEVKDNILTIFSIDGKATSHSTRILYKPTGISIIHMQHIDNFSCVIDFLHIAENNQYVESAKFLNMDICLSNRSDVLLVTISSAAAQYNGYSSKHEFQSRPYQYGLDYVRITQSAPRRWYIDDYEKIKAILSIQPYKKIVLLGTSIGAFAALWLAEILAKDNPNTQYCSVAIQVLTSLEQSFVDEFTQKFHVGYRSAVPEQNTLDSYQHLETDIQQLLKNNLSNVEHYIFYDRLNKAETLSAERLVSNHVHLHGLDIDASHAKGSGVILQGTAWSDYESLWRKILYPYMDTNYFLSNMPYIVF